MSFPVPESVNQYLHREVQVTKTMIKTMMGDQEVEELMNLNLSEEAQTLLVFNYDLLVDRNFELIQNE